MMWTGFGTSTSVELRGSGYGNARFGGLPRGVLDRSWHAA